ncbi:unnamed protein product [Rhizophagus irregularis]|uniref:Uncharacterized protein n=1 Tax=Rhizophagus irregularis TaxID=588596 RepID=A0A915ZC40_9GLOM|nr:unnamed protein product [Rhizophagus irregularis]
MIRDLLNGVGSIGKPCTYSEIFKFFIIPEMDNIKTFLLEFLARPMSDIVVAIAAVVVIGKAGAGADVAGTGISIGEKEGDLDFSCFYSEKRKERKGEYMGNILSKHNK